MKLTKDRLKQIIKEELEEMMQVDEVGGVNPEYDLSNLENIAYSIGSILRGQGSAGVPQSMGTIVDKIEYPPRNVDIPPKFKDGVNRFFKVQKSPDSFLKLNNLPYIESIPGIIRDVAEFFLDVNRQKALGLGIDPSEKQQYLKAANSLESMIKTAGDMIKQGKSQLPPVPTQGANTPSAAQPATQPAAQQTYRDRVNAQRQRLAAQKAASDARRAGR